ncbi:hypothetical protein EI94DRAFT_1704916 [Lactarius quietus]|nr:hypothetical protein EI94DRAFT_1704916 [Lactarius quietus]
MSTATSNVHRVHPIFASFIGDYPEQVLTTCTLNGDCPTCGTTRDDLSDFDPDNMPTPCSLNDTLAVLDSFNVDPAGFLQGVIKHLKSWILSASTPPPLQRCKDAEGSKDSVLKYIKWLHIDLAKDIYAAMNHKDKALINDGTGMELGIKVAVLPHMAYVEWYSQLTKPEPNNGMYKIRPQKDSDGNRICSIVPVDQLGMPGSSPKCGPNPNWTRPHPGSGSVWFAVWKILNFWVQSGLWFT